MTLLLFCTDSPPKSFRDSLFGSYMIKKFRGLNPNRIQGKHLNDSVRGKTTIETEIGLTEMVKWADAM